MAESPLRGSQRPAEPRPERRLAAILAADIDLYPITVHDDEAHRRVTQEMNWLREAVIQASGTIFTFAGVGLMAEFTSATEALKCALRFQANLARRKTDETEPTRFRMAVNAGEILAGNRHIGRAAMNLAARLERIAPPGGIALPVALHDQLRHVVSVPVTPLDQRDPPDMTQAFAVSISAEACLLWADHPATRKRAPSRPIADSRASLAVIPFGADGGREQLAAAVADDVVHALGGLTTWLAVTRTQAAKIRTPIDLHRLRQTSSARYILHGSAEAEREMLRLTVELNEVETGRVLWSDRFDRLLDAQAALREDAATRIACAIPSLVFQRELDRSALARPDTLTAHDLALRAFSAIMLPERDAFAAAGGLLRQAEQRAGPHGSTWFSATWWHLMAISQGWSADPAADVREAVESAARMDRNDPAAMSLLAYVQSVAHRDHELAAAMLDRMIDTAPFCAMAWTLKSLTLCQQGEGQAAIFHAEKAEMMPALGPERAWRDHLTGLAYYVAGRYGDAARWARVSAMHHPGLAANARVLAASLAVLGRLDEAHQAARRVLAVDPDFHIGAWRQRSLLPPDIRDIFGQRLRLAGLPE